MANESKKRIVVRDCCFDKKKSNEPFQHDPADSCSGDFLNNHPALSVLLWLFLILGTIYFFLQIFSFITTAHFINSIF